MSDKKPTIVWFRNDLRLRDNPALRAAANAGPVLAIYVFEKDCGERPIGAASLWWLHHSLTSLRRDLAERGVQLILRKGDPRVIIPALAKDIGAGGIYWNRRYATDEVERDGELKELLTGDGYEAKSFNGSLLFEPWEIKTGGGEFYKVFSPFWRACLKADAPAEPDRIPTYLDGYGQNQKSDALADWELLPKRPNWASGFGDHWSPGEDGAQKRLGHFLSGPVKTYPDKRNRPDVSDGTSGLSPHLHFGEISPRQVWHAVKSSELGDTKGADKFLSEIGWREFSHNLLFNLKDLANENYKSQFDGFPWAKDKDALERWQRGETGYPFVDAGLRELWATGYMHNRVRMVVGSFLTKHLLIHWKDGEEWFWDCLLDADIANNTASWQWVAGCGADAAPYFRIFNPFGQGEKFDPNGEYTRKWVPELKDVPDKYLQTPWEAPAHVLAQAGVKLGKTYPKPMVDHKQARERALAAYSEIKGT